MKNIGIFISSTFIDMQAERDYIKKIIIPQLQHHFRNDNINIYTIDLRWGVDTSSVDFDEAREAKVLDVCFNTIRNSRPYFVGLIGNRYGWIPSKDRQIELCSLFSSEDDFMLEYIDGRSVTEMEMLYGALGKKELVPHSYFFFRSDSVYEQMPADIRVNYEDSDPVKQYKLQQLKNKIYSTYRQNNNENHIFDYTPKYDPKRCVLTSFEEFGQKFTQALIEDISKECKDYQPNSVHDENDIYFKKKANTYCGHRKIISELLEFIHDFNPQISNPINGYILCGISGCGKTTIMSKVYSDLVNFDIDSKYLILTQVVGSTPESLSYWEMINKWNRELEHKLDIHYIEKDVILYFEKLLMYAVVNGYKPVIFIDTYDKFQKGDLAFQYIGTNVDTYKTFSSLSFIPRFIPFICTSIKEYLDDDILNNSYFKICDIENFSYYDANELIKYSLKRKELSQKALTLLLSKTRSDGTPSYAHPIWIKIAMALLDEMGNMEFSKISKEETIREDQKIDDYICNFIDNFSAEPNMLFQQFVSLGMGYFSKDIISTTTKLLAISKFGVSEYEIEQFLGNKWNQLDFSYVIRWLSPFIEKETITNSWKFAHDILKQSIEKDDDDIKRKYVLSLLPTSCYDWRTLKECFSLIVNIGDVYLFWQAICVFDFLYCANNRFELRNQKIISNIIDQVGIAQLSSIIAKSVEKFMRDDFYFSNLMSFTLRLNEEYEDQEISDESYSAFYHYLYNNIDIQVKIDCNTYGFDYILSLIYSQCVVRDVGPLSDRYLLYSEYIEIVKKKYRKFGPDLYFLDVRDFYKTIYDYITLRMLSCEFARFNEDEKKNYCIILRQRLIEIDNEIDWLILFTAITPEDVKHNGELLSSILASIVSDYNWLNNWFQEEDIPTKIIPEICYKITEKSCSQLDFLDGITDANIQFSIGRYYYEKCLYQDSYNWLIKAAEQNQAYAEYYIGEMYYEGNGIEQNIDYSVEWYIKSAQHGNRLAQNALGSLYKRGIGVLKNYDLAKKWYLLSAQQGSYYAQKNLGDFYFDGLDGQVDYEQAFKWYFKAALRQNAYSQYVVGMMLMKGIGVKEDKSKALFWLNLAKKAGDKWAIEYLEQYESNRSDIHDDNSGVESHPTDQSSCKLPAKIKSLIYNVNKDVSFPDNCADFATFTDYMILHFINFENLGIRYNFHCTVNWPSRRFVGYNMTFIGSISRQLVHLYILSRRCRALIQDDDYVRKFEMNLLNYYLENNQRENARRLVFEKLELAFRYSFPNRRSIPDPFWIFRLFVINNMLHNSEGEVLTIYEMLQAMSKFTEYEEDVAKESEGLIVYCKTKSEISINSTYYIESRYGYCDVNGNVVLPFEYEYASFFYNGEALVCKNNQWYYINHHGEKIRNLYGLSLDMYLNNNTYGGLAFQQRVQQIQFILKNGPADQQFYMAEILDDKLGLKEEAAKIFELAADAGHPKAQLSIGFMYYKGYGVEHNRNKAFYWLRKGANQGNEMCKHWLKEIASERRILKKVTALIMEHDSEFCFIDKEHVLRYEGNEYRADLLFYHLYLRSKVAIELKIRSFNPYYQQHVVDKLNFYLSLLDKQEKDDDENPSIGILLYADKNVLRVELALQNVDNSKKDEKYQNILPNNKLQELIIGEINRSHFLI